MGKKTPLRTEKDIRKLLIDQSPAFLDTVYPSLFAVLPIQYLTRFSQNDENQLSTIVFTTRRLELLKLIMYLVLHNTK